MLDIHTALESRFGDFEHIHFRGDTTDRFALTATPFLAVARCAGPAKKEAKRARPCLGPPLRYGSPPSGVAQADDGPE